MLGHIRTLPYVRAELCCPAAVRQPGYLQASSRRPIEALRPRLTTGLPFSLAHTRMRIPCYEHTIHRFAAPRNTPRRMHFACRRCPPVLFCLTLCCPSCLPVGDEFRVKSWPTSQNSVNANFHEKAHFVKGDVAAPFVLERYGSVSFAPCFHPHCQ